MNLEIYIWFRKGIEAFLEDESLTVWQGISRETLLSLLSQVLDKEKIGLDEALSLLEQIITGALTAPSIPENLETLLQDLAVVEEKNKKAQEEAARKTEEFLKEQQKLAEEVARRKKPIVPLAREVTPSPKEEKEKVPDYVQAEEKVEELLQTTTQDLVIRQGLKEAKIEPDSPEAKKFIEGLSPEEKKEITSSSQKLADKIKERIARQLLAFPEGAEINESTYRETLQNLWPEIREAFEEKGVSLKGPEAKEFIENLAQKTFQQANLIAAKGERAFPEPIAEGLASEEEGVVFATIYPVFSPSTWSPLVQKAALAPIVKPLQFIVRAAGDELVRPEELDQMLHEGLFAEDLKASIDTLVTAGLPENHPTVVKLEQKRKAFLSLEQQRPILTRILKSYHKFSKITGKRQIRLPEIRRFLPRLSPPPAWATKRGYSWGIRQVFNKIGVFSRLYQKVRIGKGKTVVRFVLPDRLTRIFTFGKIKSFTHLQVAVYRKTLKPIIARLGKTALGKAVGAGAKKVATWLATRLGIEAGVAVAGAAAGPPGWVAAAVTIAVDLGIQVVKFVAEKAKSFFKKLTEKPETLIATGVVVGALGFIIPASFLLIIGGLFVGAGTLAAAPTLLVGVQAGIASLFGQVAAFPAAFFSTLAAPVSAAALIIVTLGIIGGLSAATFFQVMIPSAAFILPHAPGAPGEIITIGEPVPPGDPDDPSLHLAERVIAIINRCNYRFVTKTNMDKVADCLRNSSLSESQVATIIGHFKDSVRVDPLNPYLQCVGFVRGIMGALGRDPRGRNALDYLNPPAPTGYEGPYYKNRINELRRDDLAIWKNPWPGHIVIVIRREEDLAVIAQAWGNTGYLSVSRVTPGYFDGFIRPIL